jgi:hypothetical protein
MKKKLFVLAGIAVLATSVACSTDNGSDDPNGNTELKVRLASYAESDQDESWADIYKYQYGADGKVSKITREGTDGVLNREYTFAYAASGLTITVDKKEGDPAYTYATITFGGNGYAASLKDEWDETYAYTYNADGYMTNVKRDGANRSDITVEDGCIATWTRSQNDVWQTKDHTYSTEKNVAGIHNIYSEQFGSSRWLMETGMFGKANAYLCTGNKWQHSDVGSALTYALDDAQCVTRETKDYDGWKEYYSYTWTKLEE